MKPQEALTKTYSDPVKSIWDGATNEWVRNLKPGNFGRMTEQLALSCIGGALSKNSTIGYDIDAGGKKIEVKASSMSISNGYPILSWKAIRPTDHYDYIFFIAIYPEDTRVFLVPRCDIPRKALSPMNTDRSKGANRSKTLTYQIHVRKVHDVPHWMAKNELLDVNGSFEQMQKHTDSHN